VSAAQLSSLRTATKKRGLESQCSHFMDAEIKWLFCLLHDPETIEDLQQKIANTKGPMNIHLHVTKAPCDLCAQMLVLKYPEIVKRYNAEERGLEIFVTAAAGYGVDHGCIGLEKLSAHNKHIHFSRAGDGIDKGMNSFGFASV